MLISNISKRIIHLIVILLVILFLFPSIAVYSQSEEEFELMPGENTFANLKANFYEARTGLLYYPSTGYFKVDAGDAIDILRYYSSSSSQYSFGSEFFIHALGLNIKTKRLPIDAADGYFGVYFSYSDCSKNFKARLRILHNSAHLVDGHLERNTTYKSSVDYTKDFAELTVMQSFNISRRSVSANSGLSEEDGSGAKTDYAILKFDFYTGASYSIIIHPKDLKRLTTLGGIQISSDQIINSLFGKPINLFCAYHFNLTTTPAYVGTNHLLSGIRFGDWESSALTLFLSYYNGSNLFNQYYNERVKELSIGFLIN